MASKNKRYVTLYIAFIAVYLFQNILMTPDKTALRKYHLDITQAKLLTLTVAIPYIIIWVVALLGYLRLKTYAKFIQKDKDGDAFKKVSQGLLLLSLWLPLSTIVANFFSRLYTSHHSETAGLIRLANYLNLIILVLGFWLVNIGTKQLLPLIKKPAFSPSQVVVLAYVAFSALYVSLALHDPAREFSTRSVTVAAYYEPDWLLVVTLIIPRLVYWFLGIQAAQNIYLYHKKVKGKLYRTALNKLAIGLAGVVAITILLSCLQSLNSPLGQLNLALLLVLVYILLALISISYIFIAKGAKSLQQLEEL